jgi:hypothetical protein
MTMRRVPLISILLYVLPSLAFASTTTDILSQVSGLFYIIVGLAVVMAVLLMGAGIILWAARLGTDETYRDQAIDLMEWGVATLFTLILVLGIVEFIQSHSAIVLYIIGVCIIIVLIWFILTSGIFVFGKGKKEEEE